MSPFLRSARRSRRAALRAEARFLSLRRLQRAHALRLAAAMQEQRVAAARLGAARRGIERSCASSASVVPARLAQRLALWRGAERASAHQLDSAAVSMRELQARSRKLSTAVFKARRSADYFYAGGVAAERRLAAAARLAGESD